MKCLSILLMALLLPLSGCRVAPNGSASAPPPQLSTVDTDSVLRDVTLSVLEVDATGATFIIENDSSSTIYYEEGNHLDQKMEDGWIKVSSYHKVPPPAIEYVLESNSSAEYTTGWDVLDQGDYRFSMPVYNTTGQQQNGQQRTVYYLICEFNIA